jgi:putative transcriptional regulator
MMLRRPKAATRTLAILHETMSGLHKAGVLDRETMREFDAGCLAPVEKLEPDAIKALRERERISQPVFAHYLNVSKGTVSKWERGEKTPDGASLKLLNLVMRKGLEGIM